MVATLKAIANIGTAGAVSILTGVASVVIYYRTENASVTLWVLLTAIVCGVVVIVGHDIADRLERRSAEREQQWWTLIEFLTDERNERLDQDAAIQAIRDEAESRHVVTTYPFRLKAEDRADAPRTL